MLHYHRRTGILLDARIGELGAGASKMSNPSMKIKLRFPQAGIDAIKAMGLRQINPETLRWTTDHPASHYGTGVLLRGKSGEILDGHNFEVMHTSFGAWIECDSADTKRRVENALVTAASGLDDAIKVAA
jgi:hypothetical protein